MRVRMDLRLSMARTRPPHRLVDKPLGDRVQLDVLGLAELCEPLERLLRAGPRPAADDADCLIDHRPVAQRSVKSLRPLLAAARSCALYTDTAAGPAN